MWLVQEDGWCAEVRAAEAHKQRIATGGEGSMERCEREVGIGVNAFGMIPVIGY